MIFMAGSERSKAAVKGRGRRMKGRENGNVWYTVVRKRKKRGRKYNNNTKDGTTRS